MTKRKNLLLTVLLVGYCMLTIILGTGIFRYPYWLVGVLIGLSILVLSIAESNWKIRDWYTFVISGLTISLVILISYWMDRAVNPEPATVSDVILGLSAMATVLMVFYVALQTRATKESIEEMKIQRLINVVLPASSMLLEIKDLIQDNEECLKGRGRCIGYAGETAWREGIFNQLRDLKEYLKKSELAFTTSLVHGDRLYQALEEYQTTITSLKQAYSALSRVLNENPKISEIIHTVIIKHCCEDNIEKENYHILCAGMNLVPIEYRQFEPKKVTELKGAILYLLFSIYSGNEIAEECYNELIRSLKTTQSSISWNKEESTIGILADLKRYTVRLKQFHESLPRQIDRFIDEIKDKYILRKNKDFHG